MNPTRILRFEPMEPRIALAANASDPLADLQAVIEGGDYDPQAVLEMVATYKESQTDSPSTPAPPSVPTSADLGDEPIVRFRVDIRDMQDKVVKDLQAGHEYVANVFVQDTRELASDDRLNGGVFQAWVDLQFSENLRPTGELDLNDAFTSPAVTPEIDGASFRNLGGVNGALIPFGNDEQFLLAAPFVVDTTDIATRIEVLPSTAQRDAVLVYGLNDPIPSANITANPFDLPTTIINPGESTHPPTSMNLIDPIPAPDGMYSSTASPNPSYDRYAPSSSDDSVRLISFFPAYQSDNPAGYMKWRDEDWFRPRRAADEKHRDDDWTELSLPRESAQTLDSSKTSESEFGSVDEDETDDKSEDDLGNRRSKHAGSFYDDTLFLEGALVETFQSRFRLHLQVFAPQPPSDDQADGSIGNWNSKPEQDGFIDIAKILTPNRATRPWQENVDKAIADNPEAAPSSHDAPTIDWGTIQPLPSALMPRDREARQPDKQADTNQKLPDERTPLAMSPQVKVPPDAGPSPTVQ